MIETYDLLLTYAIFAVFAYVNQITATLWLDYDEESLGAALMNRNPNAIANVFIHGSRTVMSFVLLGVTAHLIFVKGTSVGTQQSFMRTFFALYCFSLANSLRITLTKIIAVSMNSKYTDGKRSLRYGSGRHVFYKTFFASLTDSKIEVEGILKDGKTSPQFVESLFETISVFLSSGALAAFCFAIQGKFYATTNGTDDRIWTDWLIMICGLVAVVGLVFFYFALYKTVRSFVTVKAGDGIIAYDVSLPYWFQYLMTVITISTFTVLYGDYARIFMLYILFVGVVYGQIGWKGDPDAWYEAHSTAITTLCEFTFYPILFKIMDWNQGADGSADMLADGSGLAFPYDWDFAPLRVQYMISFWPKVSLAVVAVTMLAMGVFEGWKNEDFAYKRSVKFPSLFPLKESQKYQD